MYIVHPVPYTSSSSDTLPIVVIDHMYGMVNKMTRHAQYLNENEFHV